MSDYRVIFSHEFEDGHSGPARSYWNVLTATGLKLGTVCFHHRGEHPSVQSYAENVGHMLAKAHQRGREEMQREIRKALGL